MKYRYLGSSGLLMFASTLGTMTFGAPDWGCDQKSNTWKCFFFFLLLTRSSYVLSLLSSRLIAS